MKNFQGWVNDFVQFPDQLADACKLEFPWAAAHQEQVTVFYPCLSFHFYTISEHPAFSVKRLKPVSEKMLYRKYSRGGKGGYHQPNFSWSKIRANINPGLIPFPPSTVTFHVFLKEVHRVRHRMCLSLLGTLVSDICADTRGGTTGNSFCMCLLLAVACCCAHGFYACKKVLCLSRWALPCCGESRFQTSTPQIPALP